jgi:hypothetical protein
VATTFADRWGVPVQALVMANTVAANAVAASTVAASTTEPSR